MPQDKLLALRLNKPVLVNSASKRGDKLNTKLRKNLTTRLHHIGFNKQMIASRTRSKAAGVSVPISEAIKLMFAVNNLPGRSL